MANKLGTIGNYKDKRLYGFTMTNAQEIFVGAGYRRHHDGGWIRHVGRGRRFHIHKGPIKDTYELHFDDLGPRNMHKMSNNREMLKAEYGRIVKSLRAKDQVLKMPFKNSSGNTPVQKTRQSRSVLRTVIVVLLAILSTIIITKVFN